MPNRVIAGAALLMLAATSLPAQSPQRIAGPVSNPGYVTIARTVVSEAATPALGWPSGAVQPASGRRVVGWTVLGAVAGLVTCTAISNISEDEGGFHTCTAKGNILSGAGGAVVGALYALLTD